MEMVSLIAETGVVHSNEGRAQNRDAVDAHHLHGARRAERVSAGAAACELDQPDAGVGQQQTSGDRVQVAVREPRRAAAEEELESWPAKTSLPGLLMKVMSPRR
jgi:hypothetical protein